MPKVDGVEQNTSEWLRKRIGCVTASHAGDMVAKLVRKDGEAARRREYRERVVMERWMSRAMETYVTQEMQWGIDHQEQARERYEIETGVLL